MADLYDPRNVAVIVNGQEIVGFAEGTFIRGERAAERYPEPHVGAKGEVTWFRNGNNTGMVTITLKHDSASNAFLTRLFRQQDQPGTLITIPVQDWNFDGYVSISGIDCRIVTVPPWERGAEVGSVEWVIRVAGFDAAFEGATRA